MKTHVNSIIVGVVMAVVGVVLWRTAGNVDTPVISLDKLGLVLLVLGVIEVAISGFAVLTTRR